MMQIAPRRAASTVAEPRLTPYTDQRRRAGLPALNAHRRPREGAAAVPPSAAARPGHLCFWALTPLGADTHHRP